MKRLAFITLILIVGQIFAKTSPLVAVPAINGAVSDGGGTMEIAEGGIVDFTDSAMFAERILSEPVALNGIDRTNWATNGVVWDARATLPESVADPEVRDNGVVVLSDDNGQCKSVTLTNQVVKIDEPWNVEFHVLAQMRNVDTAALFGNHGANYMGEAFCFSIRPNGAATARSSLSSKNSLCESQGKYQ